MCDAAPQANPAYETPKHGDAPRSTRTSGDRLGDRVRVRQHRQTLSLIALFVPCFAVWRRWEAHSASVLSLRLRRTPCGLSQTNLPWLTFPVAFQFRKDRMRIGTELFSLSLLNDASLCPNLVGINHHTADDAILIFKVRIK